MTDLEGSGSTHQLINFVNSIQLSDLSYETPERAKDLVLDHFGVAILGTTLQWSQIVRDVLFSEGGTEESAIYAGLFADIGSKRVAYQRCRCSCERVGRHDLQRAKV